MKAEQITAVMKEMEALFIEFSMRNNAINMNGKPHDMQMAAVSSLQREQAKKAADIVFKHCAWPARLAEQLDRVSAYIKANPERGTTDA